MTPGQKGVVNLSLAENMIIALHCRDNIDDCSISNQAAPLEANVGRALEEFREYAEELKYRTAGGEKSLRDGLELCSL